MSDVSIVGTGVMGCALVEAFAASGTDVTVWNRTKEKAEALAGPRVRTAESVAEALTSSPLTIVSVSGHELSRALVEEAGVDLAGNVVASTAFVTPEQGRDFDAVVRAAGGHYLDLSIPAYPSQVRSGNGVLLLSGERVAYDTHRERFERIGRVSYVDAAPAAAFISEMAVVLAYLPMAVGLLQGLQICERHDVPLGWFEEIALELYPFQIRSLLERVTKQPDASQRSVESSIAEWGQTAADYADYLRELGLDTRMYDALRQLFAAASAAGHGGADWTGIAEYAATR